MAINDAGIPLEEIQYINARHFHPRGRFEQAKAIAEVFETIGPMLSHPPSCQTDTDVDGRRQWSHLFPLWWWITDLSLLISILKNPMKLCLLNILPEDRNGIWHLLVQPYSDSRNQFLNWLSVNLKKTINSKPIYKFMTNEEIIEKIRTTPGMLNSEIDVEWIQPDAPLMQTWNWWPDLVDMVVLGLTRISVSPLQPKILPVSKPSRISIIQFHICKKKTDVRNMER